MWRCSDSCWYRWEEGGVVNSAELTTSAADGDWVIDHCEADPIATCGTGKTWDEFTESCGCDNGSREEDCWLPPDEPGCDDVFEECGGDDGDDTGGGSGPCTTCQPDEPPGYPPDGVPLDEYERLNREERRLCWANAAECSGVNSARHMADEFSEARAAQDGFSGVIANMANANPPQLVVTPAC